MHAELAYLFRHALLRDAAYELQPPRLRAELHGAAALSLEVLPDAGSSSAALEIATHAMYAREGNAPGDWLKLEQKWLAIAGDRADREFQNRAAAEIFGRLAQLHDKDSDERLRAHIREAHMWQRGGATARAQAVFDDAIEEGSRLRSLTLADARIGRAGLLMDLGHFDDSERDLVDMLEDGIGVSASARLRAEYNLALHRIHDGDTLVQELEKLRGDAEVANDHVIGGQILATQGRILRMMGKLQLAEAKARAAVTYFRKHDLKRGESTAMGMLGHVFEDKGGLVEAEAQYRESLELLRRTGDLRFLGIVGSRLAQTLKKMGQLDAARETSDRALAALNEHGAADDYAEMAPERALLLAEMGDRDEALALLADATATVKRLNIPHRIEAIDEARKQIE